MNIEDLENFLDKNIDWPARGQEIIDLWMEANPKEVKITAKLITSLYPAQEYNSTEQIVNAIRATEESLV